jgi:DNA-binding transcriptional ArsR family regulator
MNIEDVFSSKLRIKIIKILNQVSSLNVSEIARRLGANYKTTDRHLRILEEAGLVRQKLFGRIRLYFINEASPRMKALQSLMAIWEDKDNFPRPSS